MLEKFMRSFNHQP